MPLFDLPPAARPLRVSSDRDGDAEVRLSPANRRRPSYFFFAGALRAAFFFAAGFFLAAFLAAFFAGFRFAVLANVLLLSMLSRESAHKLILVQLPR